MSTIYTNVSFLFYILLTYINIYMMQNLLTEFSLFDGGKDYGSGESSVGEVFEDGIQVNPCKRLSGETIPLSPKDSYRYKLIKNIKQEKE